MLKIRRNRKLIESGNTILAIEQMEKISKRKLYKYLNLTYLSPKIVDKLIEGKIIIPLADICDIASKYKDFDEQGKAI